MTRDCDYWMDLADRVALGEGVSDREIQFLRTHEASCRSCARETAVFRELGPSTLHAVPSAEEIERVLTQAALFVPPAPNDDAGTGSQPQASKLLLAKARERVRAHPKALLWGAAALVASAAALVLVLRGGADQPAAPPAAVANVVATQAAPKAAVASDTPNDNLVATNTEDTCGTLVTGIVLCLVGGSEVGKVELSTPERVVHLKRGRAIAMLEPQPPGTSFSIATDAGKVTAVGTVFSVEVLADGGVVARVSRGKVRVRSSAPQGEQALLAGQRVRLGESGGSRLTEAEKRRDLSLLETLMPNEAEANEHGEVLDLDLDLEAENSRPRPRDVKDALAEARELRARGEFARAATVYRELHARDPNGGSGRAALVSLGGLLLSSLNDSSGALSAFNRYLAGGRGPLTQQAEYGRIRALRALGRKNEARAAINAFVKRYPSAPETRSLKQGDDGSLPR
jgi:hypothetical protein